MKLLRKSFIHIVYTRFDVELLPNGYRALFKKKIIINPEERSPSLQHRLMLNDTIVVHIYQPFVRRKNDTANRMLNTPAVMYFTPYNWYQTECLAVRFRPSRSSVITSFNPLRFGHPNSLAFHA
jgi:hypothetical protein